MNANLTYPALNNEAVTEAHTNICNERGHAVHTVDGVIQEMCPRCGHVPATATLDTTATATFEQIFNAEEQVRFAKDRVNAIKARMTVGSLDKAIEVHTHHLDKLNEALNSLTTAQMASYGAYRKARIS